MSQVDEIGPWSEDKLELLRQYLNAYVAIMRAQEKKWRFGYHYVDAFAGTGRPRARDEARYVDGSPRVALNLPFPFHSYAFIEQDPKRVEKLKELEVEFPRQRIDIYLGDCNEILANRVIPRIRYERYQRGLIFLDPFGMDVEWETVEKIAEAKSLEVFVNFPVMAINRAVLLRNPYNLTDAQIERMSQFWGTDEWRGNVYEEVQTLFGPSEIKAHRTTGQYLGQLYKARLQTVFPHATDPLVMTNSRNAPLYCLIFAGHNDTGAKIVQDIFRRYKKLGH